MEVMEQHAYTTYSFVFTASYSVFQIFGVTMVSIYCMQILSGGGGELREENVRFVLTDLTSHTGFTDQLKSIPEAYIPGSIPSWTLIRRPAGPLTPVTMATDETFFDGIGTLVRSTLLWPEL
jgi:hypothetical protein